VLLAVTRVLLGRIRVKGTLNTRNGGIDCVVICVFIYRGGMNVINRLRQLWVEENGQDVAEYAVMLAVILVIVIGTVRLIGSNANTVFSQVQSQITN
jgi:Flp pilus assembly pilin Flp